MSPRWMKPLFAVAALYDGCLGLAFFFFGDRIFQAFRVTPPNHPGYIKFPALLLVIFGLMFLQIARDPAGRRELIVYGICLKAAFSGLVFWYQATRGVPGMWIPWAWADLVFLVLFALALRPARAERKTSPV
jgi:hypothetical protein